MPRLGHFELRWPLNTGCHKGRFHMLIHTPDVVLKGRVPVYII